jgi:hypothetical protein
LAACGQNAPVRQQQRGGVVASKNRVTRHDGPRASCGIPHLRRVSGSGRFSARELSSSASASYQDFAIWEQCSGVEFASSGHHRLSVIPGGTRAVQVDDLCSFRRIGSATGTVWCAWASAHEQHFAVIVHHCRSPITSPIVAIPHQAPITSASNIKVARRRTGSSTEDLAVRRNKHEWIERQRQVRRAQIPPGRRCTLPYLRLDIGNPRSDRATDHQHISVRQRSVSRVPSTVVHIRQPRPGIVQRIICIGVGQANPGVDVSTGYQELSIRQKGVARTENVRSCTANRGIRVGRWIPQRGIVAVAERGPPQHLARRQHISMGCPKRPSRHR